MYKKHTLEEFDFLPRVSIESNGCWEWQHKRNDNGYGQVKFRGRTISAHRLSWMKYVGPIPEGKWVLHRCDNPPCCNPAHLFIGDGYVNMQDMVSKGRHVHGDDHWTRKHPERVVRGDEHPLRKNPELALRGPKSGRYGNPNKTGIGEANGNSKLTEVLVQEVRRRLADGEKQRDIAKIVGISQTQIWRVKTGLAWNTA